MASPTRANRKPPESKLSFAGSPFHDILGDRFYFFMNNKILFALVAAVVLSCHNGFAAGTTDVVTDLNALIAKVNVKIQQGRTTAKDFADELKAFDVLYARYKKTKTEDVAQILMMKAQLYLAVIDAPVGDPEKASEVFQQIKRDLPETELGKRVDEILASLKKPVEAEQIRNKLVEGSKFPGFDEKDLAGMPLSLADYKGKVVLVDFWATWCGPSVAELPNVIATYQKYHGQGFEIIGVSLDEVQPALERFLKENNMTWQQYYDGKMWDNKLAMAYGVNSTPTTYLLGRDGKIIGRDLRGEALQAAVAKALAKK
jgi:thiol-disulfide isomerase/thioredoxin